MELLYNSMKKSLLLSVIDSLLCIIAGSFFTIIFYRWQLGTISSNLEQLYRGATLSGSFFIDWPLRLLIFTIPIFVILVFIRVVLSRRVVVKSDKEDVVPISILQDLNKKKV